jgi:poly [ADP-ribose] polymerase 10/14/15
LEDFLAYRQYDEVLEPTEETGLSSSQVGIGDQTIVLSLEEAAAAEQKLAMPGGVGPKREPLVKLEKCPGCVRSFKPTLLQAHIKQCPGLAEQSAEQKRSREQQQLKQMLSKVESRVYVPRASPQPEALSQLPDDETLQSSNALVARGLLTPASHEEDVARLRLELDAAVPGAEFVGAYEVNHSAHRGIYDALRESMCYQLKSQGSDEAPGERDLWHGTSWSFLTKILQQGFNRIFAGRHGKLLGVATYFSTDLAYSNRFCDRHGGGKEGTKVVILARVLTGKHCKGSSSDVEPPLICPEGGLRYDSTVDNSEHPKIFAIFKDFQALPLYVLEFRS